MNQKMSFNILNGCQRILYYNYSIIDDVVYNKLNDVIRGEVTYRYTKVHFKTSGLREPLVHLFIDKLSNSCAVCHVFRFVVSEHIFSGVRVIRSLVLCVCFVDRCLSFCPFCFGHLIVCPSSIYGF